MAKKEIKLPEGFIPLEEGDPADEGIYLGYFVFPDGMEFEAEIQYRDGIGFLTDNPEAELVGWAHKPGHRSDKAWK